MRTRIVTSAPGVNGQFVDPANAPDATVEEIYSGASREFNNFVTDIEELVKATTSLTGEDLAAAKTKLNARIAAARDSISEISDTVTQRVRKSAAATNNYVHDKPWQAIGIGAAAGMLLGFVFGRRS